MLSRAATPAGFDGRFVVEALITLPAQPNPDLPSPASFFHIFSPSPLVRHARPYFFSLLFAYLQKCDEQPNEEGACQTCVRLRLQCLGFGAKRPDWMRVRVLSRSDSALEAHRVIISAGEQQRHRAAREDQDLPRFAGHDQGPLWLRSPDNRAGPASSCSRRPSPHLALQSPHPHTLRHVERGPAAPPSQRHDQHVLRACSSHSLRHDASSPRPATLPAEYVPSYLHPCGVVVNSWADWQHPMPDMGPHDPAMNRGPMLPNVNDMLYHPSAPAPPQPQPPTMIQSPTSVVSASSSCKAPYRY